MKVQAATGLPVVTEDVLRRTAHIIGEHSAAGKALAEIDERRARGQNPLCLQFADSLLVVDANALIDLDPPAEDSEAGA